MYANRNYSDKSVMSFSDFNYNKNLSTFLIFFVKSLLKQ